MEYKELKNKTKNELDKILSDDRHNLRDLQFKVANRQLKNVRSIRVIKKNIARILTIFNKKDK